MSNISYFALRNVQNIYIISNMKWSFIFFIFFLNSSFNANFANFKHSLTSWQKENMCLAQLNIKAIISQCPTFLNYWHIFITLLSKVGHWEFISLMLSCARHIFSFSHDVKECLKLAKLASKLQFKKKYENYKTSVHVRKNENVL